MDITLHLRLGNPIYIPGTALVDLLFGDGEAGAMYDISDLSTLWQDAAGTTAATTVDDPVGRVDDLSGNGNHMLLGTSETHRPFLKISGGVQWLEFDGSNDHLKATFALPQPWDRVSMIRQLSWTSADNIFYGAASARGTLQQTGSSPNLGIYNHSYLNGSGEALNTDQLIFERYNGASSELAIDGNSVTGTTGTTTAADGMTVGAANSGASPANFRWYGSIMRPAMSASERAAAEAWASGLV